MRRLVCLLALSLSSLAPAQELKELLDKGQVVLLETDDQGRFRQATAIVQVGRPVEEVWAVVTDLGHYSEFMPKVVKSDARKLAEHRWQMDLEIEVPGVNTAYTLRYDMDPAQHVMKGKWVRGDIKDSAIQWRLVPYQGTTLVYYTVATKNFSGLAESLEDGNQTVTIGVNVGAALGAARAVKARAERKAEPKPP